MTHAVAVEPGCHGLRVGQNADPDDGDTGLVHPVHRVVLPRRYVVAEWRDQSSPLLSRQVDHSQRQRGEVGAFNQQLNAIPGTAAD
jgi:hypothetical protein